MEGGKEGETNRKREVLKRGSPLDRLTASSAAAVIDISIFNSLSSAKKGEGEERCRRDH